FRETMRRRPVEMHLADGCRLVTPVAEPLSQGQDFIGESRAELRYSGRMGQLARDQRLPARRAQRRVAVGPIEPDALPGECVKVWSGTVRIAGDPEVVPAVVVGDDQEQIGWFWITRAGSRSEPLRSEGCEKCHHSGRDRDQEKLRLRIVHSVTWIRE